MRPGFTLTTLALVLATTAAVATGQAVEGVIRDADRDRVLPAARVYLVDDEGVAVDSVLSDRAGRFQLVHGATLEMDFPVPLVSIGALVQMGDIISLEPGLQAALPDICGDAFRPWEAGLLVGIVRSRATRQPIAGARISVARAGDDDVARATVSNERGTYVLCNVPVGSDVEITVVTRAGLRESTRVEIRAGTASWYDLPVGARR